MEDIKIFWDKIKKLYKALCQDEWSATTTGIVVALLTIPDHGLVAALGCCGRNP